MENNQENFEELNESYMSRTPNWITRWGNLMIFVIFVFLFIGTILVPFPEVLDAKVEIRIKDNPVKLNLDPSKDIDSIFVTNNKQVQIGEVLLAYKSEVDYEEIFLLDSLLKNDIGRINFREYKSITYKIQELLKNYEECIRDNSFENCVETRKQLELLVHKWKSENLMIAPINGQLDRFQSNSIKLLPGDGRNIFVIYPNVDSAYIANFKIYSKDINKISLGKQVLIKLDEYSTEQYGILETNISTISTIIESNENYYEVGAIMDTLVTNHNKKINYNGRLKGIATIVLNESSLFERFTNKFKN